jgi:hypothetical protein
MIKININKQYRNETDRTLRHYGGIKAFRNLAILITVPTLILGACYSLCKEDANRVKEVYDSANKYFVAASTDSAHRKEFAQRGINTIENYFFNEKEIFASTKNLETLEKDLKSLAK